MTVTERLFRFTLSTGELIRHGHIRVSELFHVFPGQPVVGCRAVGRTLTYGVRASAPAIPPRNRDPRPAKAASRRPATV